MTTIIGVRFKSNGKMYYFDPQGLEIAPGTGVIVETARGVEYGDCVQGNTDVPISRSCSRSSAWSVWQPKPI